MWHETAHEMTCMLKSIFRMDEDQCARRNAQKYLKVCPPFYSFFCFKLAYSTPKNINQLLFLVTESYRQFNYQLPRSYGYNDRNPFSGFLPPHP